MVNLASIRTDQSGELPWAQSVETIPEGSWRPLTKYYVRGESHSH